MLPRLLALLLSGYVFKRLLANLFQPGARPAALPASRTAPRPVPRDRHEPSKNGADADAAKAYAFGGAGAELTRHEDPSAAALGLGAGNPTVRGPGNLQGVSTVLQTGELRIDRIDLEVPGRGQIHFQLFRRYRSRLDFDGPIGWGWSFSYLERLYAERGNVVRHDGLGRMETWTRRADGSYQAPPGAFQDLLRRADGTFVLRAADGFKRVYRGDGRISRHEDRHGNSMVFLYDQDGKLIRIEDVYRRPYIFQYQTTVNGIARLTGVRDFTGREVCYTYDAQGNLAGVRTPIVTGTTTGNNFPGGKTEAYRYSGGFSIAALNHQLQGLWLPCEVSLGGTPAMSVAYGADPSDPLHLGRVLSQTLGGPGAAGGTLTYERELQNTGAPLGQPGLPRIKITVTERNGNKFESFIDELGHNVMIRRLTRGLRPGEPSFYESRFEYDADGQAIRIVHPEGNQSRFLYDSAGPRRSQGNLIEARSVADAARGGGEIVSTFSYEPLFNQPESITDPRGNSPGFAPPLGTAATARYRTRFYFDYQEGSGPVAEAAEFGIDLGGVARGLGDINADGRVNQAQGNVVRIEHPAVTLRPDSHEAARRGTSQPVVHEFQWNDAGQPLKMVDAIGNVCRYEYYPGNGYIRAIIKDAEVSARRLAAAAPVRQTATYTYDAAGNVISVMNARGVVMEFEVNALNQVVRVTRGADAIQALARRELAPTETAYKYDTRLFYDENNRIVRSQIDNRDPATAGLGSFLEYEYSYDILSNPIRWSTKPNASSVLTWDTSYDSNSLLQRVTLPEGNATAFAYDERDLVLSQTRGAGTPGESTIRFSYDKNGNCAEAMDGQNQKTVFRYDGLDRLTQAIDAIGNQESYLYDPLGAVVRKTVMGHPAGRPGAALTRLSDVQYRHDELGRLFQFDEALFVSDGFNPARPPNLQDGNGDGVVSAWLEYDAEGNLIYATADDGATTSFEYDGGNRPVKTTDAAGNIRIVQYDSNSNPRVVRSLEVSPEGLAPAESHATYLFYDQLDRLTCVSADGTWRYAYDSRDNVIMASDAEGALVNAPPGFPIAQVNEQGNTTRYLYDGMDRLIRVTSDLRIGGAGGNALDPSNPFNPQGTVTLRYEYDGNSRLTGVLDHGGNRTEFGYDELDRRILQRNADQTEIHYAYDRNDNLRHLTDPNGSHTELRYDAVNRRISSRVTPGPGVAGTTEEAFGYDGLARLTHVSDNNGGAAPQTTERVYDSLSRVVEERQNGQVISHAWINDDKIASTTYPGSRQIAFAHDAIGRLKTISGQGGSILDCSYIGSGVRELIRRMGDGTSISYLDAASRVKGYDSGNRISRQEFMLPGGTKFLDREYGYNRVGKRVSETRHDDAGLVDRFSYDSIYRLTRAAYDEAGTGGVPRSSTGEQFVYDGVGNRRGVHPINSVNEYARIGSTDFTYDRNGNLISDGVLNYVYDFKNRLVSVVRRQDGKPVAAYLYDSHNRRTRKTVFGAASSAGADHTVSFFHDGWNICEEQDEAGRTLQTFVHRGNAIDEPVQLERTANHPLGAGAFFFHQNVRGDVSAITQNGALVERRCYDAFGAPYDENKLPAASSGVGHSFGFQGREIDPETGLYYFRHRYYSPTLGRFLQRDPVWDPENRGNHYTFSGNSPVSNSDPLGLDFVEVRGNDVFYVPEGLGGLNGTELFAGRVDPTGPQSGPDMRIRVAHQNGQWVTVTYSQLEAMAEPTFTNIKDMGDLQRALNISQTPNPVQPPSFLVSLIPVYGSGRMAFYEAERGGGYSNVVAYSVLAATDVFLIRSVLTGILKVGAKVTAPAAGRLAAFWTGLKLSGQPGLMTTYVKAASSVPGKNFFLKPHFIWQLSEYYFHATGALWRNFLHVKEIVPMIGKVAPGQAIMALPVLSRELAGLAGGRALTCFTGVLTAFSRGWYHIPYMAGGRIPGRTQLPTVREPEAPPLSVPENPSLPTPLPGDTGSAGSGN